MTLCPHFRLLRDDATKTRWHLELSHDGTQKRWDVPRGPPLRPCDRHLAIEREPASPLGAACWDAGPCEVRTWTLNHIVVVLHGATIRGCFSLVRFHGIARRHWSWVRVRPGHHEHPRPRAVARQVSTVPILL